jgi:GT2 family glycosyltransferase
MNLAPIVLFVYNRPRHTRQTIEALQNNELAIDSHLYIYSDGAKDEASKSSVDEVREYIDSIDGFKSITIIKQEQNRGLANSIIEGVTKIVEEYGEIIVLEDDLITSPYFLRYMNDALEFYRDYEEVMHISGYIYPIDSSSLKDTFFIKPASCWGWATWSSAWRYFKKDSSYYLDIFDKNMIRDFNLNNSYNYFSQILSNQRGDIDTWAIFWYASIYIQNGLSLHPSRSFTHNIGHDGKGVHCKKSTIFDVDLIERYPINFSLNIIEDREAKRVLIGYFNTLKPSIYKRIYDKLYRLWKRKIW